MNFLGRILLVAMALNLAVSGWHLIFGDRSLGLQYGTLAWIVWIAAETKGIGR